jgi:hypothetical protein
VNTNQILVVLLLVVEVCAVIVIAWWLKARSRRVVALLQHEASRLRVENAHLQRERDQALERAQEEYQDAQSCREVLRSLKQVRSARVGGDQ